MPDSRRHRGAHPQDVELFCDDVVPALRAAVHDLSWLRTRGYAEASAIKLVGDRYQLRTRQRVAVGRSACSETGVTNRRSRQIEPLVISGRSVLIDGLNVLTTIEVALAGGVLLLGRDGCMRDMASFHGSYRLVHETDRAVAFLLGVVDAMQPSDALIDIDRPVSNSGRLAKTIREAAVAISSNVEAIVSDRVDETLKEASAVVATADSAILDACGQWLNLARIVVEQHRTDLQPLWLVDLS